MHRCVYSLSCKHFLSLQYDSCHDIVVSGDQSGMVEYWSGPVQEYGFPKAAKFEHKIDTDLYEFAKVTHTHTQAHTHTHIPPLPSHSRVHTHTFTPIFTHTPSHQHKTTPLSLTFSPNGRMFAVMAKDRKVRVYHTLTGRLHRVFDEALDIFTEQQQVRA